MTDTNSYTALAWAAAWADKKDISFLEALANHSKIKLNQQDSEGYTALGRAAEMGRWAWLEIARALRKPPGLDIFSSSAGKH